jgi:hypothetical protein
MEGQAQLASFFQRPTDKALILSEAHFSGAEGSAFAFRILESARPQPHHRCHIQSQKSINAAQAAPIFCPIKIREFLATERFDYNCPQKKSIRSHERLRVRKSGRRQWHNMLLVCFAPRDRSKGWSD